MAEQTQSAPGDRQGAEGEGWRRHEATGDMIIVRYADDFIVGFEYESDARRFLDAMRERLGKFALSLHPEKTRLIEFGALSRCKLQPENFIACAISPPLE